VFFEYALDTARLARRAGLANVIVTNGYATERAIAAWAPNLDAASVDLKAFRDITYRRYVGARLQPVLDGMRVLRRHRVWLEVTILVIPDINDDPGELRDAVDFIKSDLGCETPLHLSRFFPAHHMKDHPPTPLRVLRCARDIALEAGLRYVYLGNVTELDGGDTNCPNCGRSLIRRGEMGILANSVRNGRCPSCDVRIPGVSMSGKDRYLASVESRHVGRVDRARITCTILGTLNAAGLRRG